MGNEINIPFLEDMLIKAYGVDLKNEILEGYRKKRVTSLRINTLKSTKEEVLGYLDSNGIEYTEYSLIQNAYIINKSANELYDLEIVKEGKVYLQSLSSMLPPIFLDPKENETILDMAAAPGGKTTEIAALTNNKTEITALEVNKIRCARLNYNVALQGCTKVFVMNQDAKKLDDFFSFDRVLLDAPCSGSGTLDFNNTKTIKSFSYELVKNSAKLQEELLRKAIKVLKKGHQMVYSTCSILPIENEEVVKKVLGPNVRIVPISLDIKTLPTKLPGTIVVAPNELFEGFFIAKLEKI